MGSYDDLAEFNQSRWDALVDADVEYSRPWLDLTPESARQKLDPHGLIDDVSGLKVLCLAGSGGQQSAAFGLLGAQVTVLDLCGKQLEGDRRAAAHYGLTIRTVQGDMRDLSVLGETGFDIVWHPHSINFVPDCGTVIAGAARILKPGGSYRLDLANPFTQGMDERSWDGKGYPLNRPYMDGEMISDDPHWDVRDKDGHVRRVIGPREFKHTLGTIVGHLANNGFRILRFLEEVGVNPKPGTWGHFTSIAPAYLGIWARLERDRA